LPFVLEVNYDPVIEDESHHECNELRDESHMQFEPVEGDYSIPSWVRMGIIDRGYNTSVNGEWKKNYAQEIGIDESLADSFASNWEDTYNYHGNKVADTAGYFLGEGNGHSNLFVPLRYDARDDEESRTDQTRAAIEFAEKNGIQVLNMSFKIRNESDACPSVLCDLLKSYTESGYIPVASSGNNGRTQEVSHPGTGHYTITAGGMHGTCSGGFERHTSSNYGTIQFRDTTNYSFYCSTCYSDGGYSDFAPQVYGCYSFETDGVDYYGDPKTLIGTSFAAPQVAVGALIMQANGLYDYEEARSIFESMDQYEICEGDNGDPYPARRGQLLDIEYAHSRTD